MSYVTVGDLKEYSGAHDNDALLQNCIDAAENIVNACLGYSPVLRNYSQLFDGTGSGGIQLKARPIVSVASVNINGAPVPAPEFYFTHDSEFLHYDGIFPAGKRNIAVDYAAGWGTVPGDDEANGDCLPVIIVMTVLRIAALLLSESGGNIGVQSKSFADSGTRTFINTVNFDKYLIQISAFRLLVI